MSDMFRKKFSNREWWRYRQSARDFAYFESWIIYSNSPSMPICVYTNIQRGLVLIPWTLQRLLSFNKLKKNWSIVDLQCCVSGMQQSDSVIYLSISVCLSIYFLRSFSIKGYYKIMNILALDCRSKSTILCQSREKQKLFTKVFLRVNSAEQLMALVSTTLPHL